MESVRADAEGAVNHFIAQQQRQPGTCSLLLADFDAPARGQHDGWFTIRHDGDLGTATRYELVPRGGTALLDAVGRAIDLTGTRLAALPSSDRPAHVLFVVQTDGEENSSAEWSARRVRQAVEHQQDVYSWQFVFLGTAPDAWDQGDRLGFANVVRTAASPAAFRQAFDDLDQATTAVRAGHAPVMAMPHAVIDADGNASG